jgi:hypothetical protein
MSGEEKDCQIGRVVFLHQNAKLELALVTRNIQNTLESYETAGKYKDHPSSLEVHGGVVCHSVDRLLGRKIGTPSFPRLIGETEFVALLREREEAQKAFESSLSSLKVLGVTLE